MSKVAASKSKVVRSKVGLILHLVLFFMCISSEESIETVRLYKLYLAITKH